MPPLMRLGLFLIFLGLLPGILLVTGAAVGSAAIHAIAGLTTGVGVGLVLGSWIYMARNRQHECGRF